MTVVGDKVPERRFRMKELCELTELSRQTIHFYIQQGLLSPGHKTGRNMAYYSEQHLERLQMIQRLQRDSFLPLKAIKAVLDDEQEQLDGHQRQHLAHLKAQLLDDVLFETPTDTVDAASLAQEHGVELSEVRQMGELGFIAFLDSPPEGPRVPRSDTWAVELLAQLRAAGMTKELGFTVEDLALYEEAVSQIFAVEKSRLIRRLSHLSPERVAEVIRQALPAIHAFLTHYHTARIRNFFRAME